MFFLFEVTTQGFILRFVPESLEVLLFGVGLILLTVGLRWFLKRGKTNFEGEIEKSK